MGRALLARQLVFRRHVQVALGGLLQTGLGRDGLLGDVRRHVRAERALHKVVRHIVARVQVEGPADCLVYILEGRSHAARPRAPLGLAEDDELADAQLAGDLRKHGAGDQRDLEARELALVHLGEALVEVGRHDGAHDRVAQKLEALVILAHRVALDGRWMGEG